MSLAIFDLDNTLIAGDSDHAWGQFLVEQGIVDPVEYKKANDRFYELYQQGRLDIMEYLEFALQPLAAHSLAQLHTWREQFVASKITPLLLPKAEELLAQHRADGDYLLIITSTNRFVTEPIAELLSVDELIATDPELHEGRYTGKVQGIPSFREGKVQRLSTWLERTGHSLANSFFYSDSLNDLPLLDQVDHPIAVDPDPQLAAHAETNNWKIISLRD